MNQKEQYVQEKKREKGWEEKKINFLTLKLMIVPCNMNILFCVYIYVYVYIYM